MFHGSIHALREAIIEEDRRAQIVPEHAVIHVSSSTKLLVNGIKQCTVQIECEAGCGWLIEAYGNEANELHKTTLAIQRILSNVSGVHPLSQVLPMVVGHSVSDIDLVVASGTK